MGAMGRYIDALCDEQRDRLLEAPPRAWCSGWLLNDAGARCLVGHVIGPAVFAIPADNDEGERRTGLDWFYRENSPEDLAEDAFDDAVDRFGRPHVVRAIKARAARRNKSSPEAISALLSDNTSSISLGERTR